MKFKFSPLIISLFLIIFAVILTGIMVLAHVSKKYLSLNSNAAKEKQIASKAQEKAVLAGQIYIYSDGYRSSATGGVISLSSLDEPAISIGGNKLSGTAKIDLYKTNDDALLDYLTHDKDYNQTKKTPDESKLTLVKSFEQTINSLDDGARITLPLEEKGIWYAKITVGSVNTNAFIVRSGIGAITKEGDNQFIFWGQDFKTRKSLSGGIIILYNLLDGRKELQRIPFGEEGIAKTSIDSNADVALIAKDDERAFIPINLQYLNYRYSYKPFHEKIKHSKYFVFTDRPLYKPGDTIYFKAVVRDDDDARYSIPTGNAKAKIYTDYEGKDAIYDKQIPISPDGTVSGEYTLPKDAKVGYYNIAIIIPPDAIGYNYVDGQSYSNTNYFDVEYYKKPESFIEVSVEKTEFMSGDKTSFKIRGTYFSGQPLIGQKVEYSVRSADFYEYQYLQDQKSLGGENVNNFWYGTWYGKEVLTGTAILDNKGEADIDLNTKLKGNSGKSQVFTIGTSIQDQSQESPFAQKNILIYAGEYGIYRSDFGTSSKINNPVNLPLQLAAYRNTGNISNINLKAKIHRENWVAYSEPNKKYPSYKKEEDDLPDVYATTDNQGKVNLSFTPIKVGSYTITVEGKDSRDNTIDKSFYQYVTSEDIPYYENGFQSGIKITLDKQKYLPTETAHVTIYSTTADRDIFLSMERSRVDRYQIVHIDGNNKTLDIPLIGTDVPNVFVSAASFSSKDLDQSTTELNVSPETKQLLVTLTPDSKRYGPSSTSTLNIQTTDYAGNPVSADVAVWAVDKAIFELSDSKLGDIFNTFWSKRYDDTQMTHSLKGITANMEGGRGGGCFAEGTKVLMADNKEENIEDIKVGEYILTKGNNGNLVKAKVTKIYSAYDPGYLIINGNLRITPDHIIYVNKKWQEAGKIIIGDKLTDSKNNSIPVTSIEWQAGKYKVYNLEIENLHTFFADGIWVHNEKGLTRQTFKDTTYWNPSIHTDSSGHAKINFQLPDNLTTWTIAAVASTQDTKVGQATADVITTKDFIVRPILPNILRVGDEAVISALIQNFTEGDATFNLKLSFDGGSITNPNRQNFAVKSNTIEQVYWKVKAGKENPNAKFTFSATLVGAPSKGDIVIQQIPIRPYSFTEKRAEVGEGTKNFSVKFNDFTDKNKSLVTLSLSSSLVGSLPNAMEYLIDYPYGCVEQTTSRFVPALIAYLNPNFYKDSIKNKKLDEIINKSIQKLSNLQGFDGGWPWWFSGRSDPFVTAYVDEYLFAAKQAGFKVEDEVFNRAERFLEYDGYYNTANNHVFDTQDEKVAKTYALAVLGQKSSTVQLTNTANLSPDILALAVMANYLDGYTDPTTNGLNRLTHLAIREGDGVFWEKGTKENFGSRNASTALALRALLLTNGDKDLIQKAARFLSKDRQFDYWSNTFATSQVIRALTDFGKTNSEINPNYSYEVLLNEKKINSAQVSNTLQTIPDVNIPISKDNNINVSVSKNGKGNLYETLVTKEVITDRNSKAVNHGIYVKREYVNQKGSQYSIAVGDIAVVKITVGGLNTDENYAVIEDQLPAGMVPVNDNFKNSSYRNDTERYYTNYGVSDREITENGEVLSLYKIAKGEQTYRYLARVVSQGKFIVPPATASLMYAPEIYGRSDIQTIEIAEKSQVLPEIIKKTVVSPIVGNILIGAAILVAILVWLFIKKEGRYAIFLKEKIKTFFKRDSS